MDESTVFDEDLVRRLPLPLAQLYRRADSAVDPLNRHLAAFDLWEASLVLLASAAVVEYADQANPDPQIIERLKNLARPHLGQWWELARMLVPALAMRGDARYGQLAEWLLGKTRDDLPRAAGLDSALLETLGKKKKGSQTSVRLQDLFDHLVTYRNKVIAHAAPGQLADDLNQRMSRALLVGLAQLLARVDILAGRRLLYIADVRQVSGKWQIERFELLGEKARRLEPLELPRSAAAGLPDGKRVALEIPGSTPPIERLRSLHPLIMYEPQTEQVLFICGRPGERKTDYLCYTTGLHTERPDLGGEQRELLARVLKMSVDDANLREGAEQPAADPPLETPEPVPQPRQRTVGEFQLLSKLGQGGMGVVYRAWQPSLRRQVALKVLAGMGSKAEARFNREIQALGRVDDPHVVKVFTSGSDGDLWFYAMELVEGVPLSMICDRLETRKPGAAAIDLQTWHDALSTACAESRQQETPLSDPQTVPRATIPNLAREAGASAPALAAGRDYPRQIAGLLKQVARGAHSLHEAGVIHRDIKPGNIMVTANGTHAVLVDLGVAQLADDVDGKLTRTRQVVGTLRYASPQQVLAVGQLDRRTDVYSLGVTLWELLTLHPFLGATDDMPEPVLMEKIQHDEPARVRSFSPQVPVDLEAIVQKCLEKDPRQRYQTAEDLAADLERFLNNETVIARPVGPVRTAIRRVKRRPAKAIGTVAVLALLPLLFLGYCYWDAHYRVKVEYYANFTKIFGAPSGIGRVSAEESKHRFVTWKFTKRGNQVESCEAVNGRGVLSVEHGMMAFIHRQNETKRECRYVYKRNADGDLEEEIALDRAGEVVWSFHFSAKTTGYYADKRGIPRARGGTGAAFLEFVFTDNGLAKETHYLDKDGNPQANSDNVFGFTSQFDERGLEIERQFLDSNHSPALDNEGIAGFRLKYDKLGNRSDAIALAADGQPTYHKDGFAGWVRTYDRYGNVTDENYVDAAGKPIVVSAGYAKWHGEYDDRGFRIVEEYRGIDDKPMPQRGGYARATFEFDERGNEIAGACFGADGKPTLDREGYSRWTAKYDEHDNPVEKDYFGVDGQPAIIKEGYARWTSRYDEHGNSIEAAYFGIDGQPTLNKDGIAKWTAKFDDRGNHLEEAYFGADGQPTLNKEGVARYAYKYDERGNLLETAYLGVDGQPIAGKGGVAKTTAKYDDRGHRIEDAHFGVNGNPILGNLRCAKLTYRYDDKGNWTQTDFIGTDGDPIAIGNGYARWVAKYDNQANRIQESYFGTDGSPASHKNGYAGWRAKFDERHNRIEEEYFGSDGKPIAHKDGYSRWVARYDERGRRIEEAYFGVDGKPAVNGENVAKWKARYDERGNEIERTYFGADGEPTFHKEGAARWTARYDARDNQIERAFFGKHGEPVVLKDGIARWTARFDDCGHRLEEAYFGVDGKPMLGGQGAARFSYKYDVYGNRVEMSALGLDGKPVQLKDGAAKWTARFNGRGNQAEVAYFGVDGKPTRAKSGYAGWTSKFDARGNRIETTYFGPDGKPTLRNDGYARIVSEYDDRNLPTKTFYFDAQDKPIAGRVVVTSVRPGSQGARAGIRPDDVLAAYEGEPVTDWVSFLYRRRTEHQKRSAKLTLQRGDKTLTVSVKAGLLGTLLKDDCTSLPKEAIAKESVPKDAVPKDAVAKSAPQKGASEKDGHVQNASATPAKPAPAKEASVPAAEKH
jgi:eukaryotic-like serine/threonine-protein kinase